MLPPGSPGSVVAVKRRRGTAVDKADYWSDLKATLLTQMDAAPATPVPLDQIRYSSIEIGHQISYSGAAYHDISNPSATTVSSSFLECVSAVAVIVPSSATLSHPPDPALVDTTRVAMN